MAVEVRQLVIRSAIDRDMDRDTDREPGARPDETAAAGYERRSDGGECFDVEEFRLEILAECRQLFVELFEARRER